MSIIPTANTCPSALSFAFVGQMQQISKRLLASLAAVDEVHGFLKGGMSPCGATRFDTSLHDVPHSQLGHHTQSKYSCTGTERDTQNPT